MGLFVKHAPFCQIYQGIGGPSSKISRKNSTVTYSDLLGLGLNYGLICKTCPFFSDLGGVKSKIVQKLTFVPFFYIRIHSKILSSLNHKIRELMPPKRRENSPNLYYYIYCHARFVWLASGCLKTYSTKGNMVTRLYSGINTNCKKLCEKKNRDMPLYVHSQIRPTIPMVNVN